MAAEHLSPGDDLPPSDTIREAFYHPRLGAVLICSREATLGVRPTYYRVAVPAPTGPYLKHLGDWLWVRIGAGIADGPCWN